MKRAGRLLVVFVVVAGICVPLRTASASACTLCIASVKVGGQTPETEDQDAVIVTNRSAANVTSVQLRYVTAEGAVSDASQLSIGTLNAGATKVFVADSLLGLNSLAGSMASTHLAQKGGSLVLGRSTSNTVYDVVSWGKTVYAAGGPAVQLVDGSTAFMRRVNNGAMQDTDNSAADFVSAESTCSGVEINEIQTFVTDETGDPVQAWIELRGVGELSGQCTIVSASGSVYDVPASLLPEQGELGLVEGAEDEAGNTMPLYFGETTGKVWLADAVYSGGVTVYSPVDGVSYSAMARGQSYADISGIWRRTYAPTPGAANEYLAASSTDEAISTACETVTISELLPNPQGDDTGSEWIELHNAGFSLAPLATCQIDVNGSMYGFLDDDVLDVGEYRTYKILYDSAFAPKALSLKNSDETIITWQRMGADVVTQLQRVAYQDAPEGQSWSRYNAGWRWDDTPTPGVDNLSTPDMVPVLPLDPVIGDEPGQASGQASAVASQQRSDIPVRITELLPNPAAPLTDENDEFIELYNDSAEAITLKDYKLQAGNSYSYTYTFGPEVIAPHGYLVITSATSGISLSNTSGRVRLTTSSGEVVSQTDPYDSAKAGASWVLISGTWQWTYKPTPAVANVFEAAPTKAKAVKKPTTTKTKATAGKTAAAKTTKAAATNSSAQKTSTKQIAPPLHMAVLAAVGVLAVLYAAYEYRYDIANRINQLREYRSNRRTNRRAA